MGFVCYASVWRQEMDATKRILIIDPDIKSRKKYLSYLRGKDYEIETSPNVTRALDRIKEVAYDCIVADVNLPEMEGYKAVRIFKTLNPKSQVILTTAKNTIELEARVREQEIFYYYIKSFGKREFCEAISNVFRKCGKLKEGQKMNKPAKILVIDDDPDFVSATRTILESHKYDVDIAYNKNEAMDRINKFKPDLILLDIMMDRLDDGFTICYKLKHDPKLKNVPVFAISSITEETGFKFSPKTDGEYFEADDYAEKPIESSDLLSRVAALLNR